MKAEDTSAAKQTLKGIFPKPMTESYKLMPGEAQFEHNYHHLSEWRTESKVFKNTKQVTANERGARGGSDSKHGKTYG